MSRDDLTPRAPRFDSPAQEAYLRLWRVYDRLKLIEEELFAAYDLSSQQYNTLRLLCAALPGSMGTLELASRLISRAPDITRLVNKLEERTWVERQRDDSDRRNIRIRITPAGAHLLQQLEGPLAAVHERQLGHLPASELNALIAALSAAGNPHEPDDSHWKFHHAN